MRSLPILRQLVRQLTLASLAAAPLAAAPLAGACGGTTEANAQKTPVGTDAGTRETRDGAVSEDGGIATAGFDSTVCTGSSYEPLVGLTPTDRVDYVELRSQYDFGDDAGTQARVVARNGTPCSSAIDPTKCKANLGAIRSSSGWLEGAGRVEMVVPTYRYLVFTRGDQVGLVDTLDELATFLGPIDAVKEAALLVSEQGYAFECPSSNAKSLGSGAGFELIAQSGSACGVGTHFDEHRIDVSSAGALTVVETKLIRNGDPNCAVGRRPDGLVPETEHAKPSESEVGAFFASVARLEAASIPAFEQLARELVWHGAPRELVQEALRARADEVRHARITRALAERFGACVEAPVVVLGAPRALFEMARENAVEGCVRETFGAVVASIQATRAEDPEIARALSVIAEDETRHAALSWDIATWIEARLSPAQRAAVHEARAKAVTELRASLELAPSLGAQRVAGMPDAATAMRALDDMVEGLLAAA